MRLKAIFTIEAAYVYSFIALLVVGIIYLNFDLHDRVLIDSSKIQAGVRIYEANSFYYDNEKKQINTREIVCSKIFEKKGFSEKTNIRNSVTKYYKEYGLLAKKDMDINGIGKTISVSKNADFVRKGGRVIELIGEVLDEN